MSRPFWWPMSATVRPSKRPRPATIAASSARLGRRAARRSPRAGARRSRACTAAPRGGRAGRSARSPRRSAPPAMRSSCRWSRSSSPERRAPRSERQLAQLLEPLAQAGPRLSPRHWRRAVGARRRSGAARAAGRWRRCGRSGRFDSASPKSSGSFSRVVCCTTRGPVKEISAPGSATMHVAEAREAREHAAGGRVRHHADERAARVVEVLDRGDRLRQLHQREDPLLHARAARRGDGDERHPALGRASRRRARTSRRRRCPSSRP